MSRIGGQAGSGGFTLIEILIALVLMALVMATLTSAMRIVGGSWERGEAQTAANEQMARSHAFLRREWMRLERIYWGEEGQEVIAIDGDESSLRYIVAEPPFPAEPGLYAIELKIEKYRGGQALIRSRIAFYPDTEDLEHFKKLEFIDPVVLAEGAIEFTLAYADPEDLEDWAARWSEENRFPGLIRLEALDPESGEPAWPALLVHPAHEIEVACLLVEGGYCSLNQPLVGDGRAGDQQQNQNQDEQSGGQDEGGAPPENGTNQQ